MKGAPSSKKAASADLSQLLAGRQLPALDGLRAVAVAVVIAYHTGHHKIPGDLGVTGFFVLSGFLITWLLLKEMASAGEISLRSFYLRRTLRIFPAYYVLIVASFLADYLLGAPWSREYTAAGFTYWVNYYNAFRGHEGTVAHAWSLAVEEQFYLLWPLSFLALLRLGKQRALRLGLLFIILIVVSWRSLLYHVFQIGSTYVYNALDTRFDSLAIGCLLAALSSSPRFLTIARALACRTYLPLLVLGLLLCSRLGGGSAYRYSIGFTIDSLLIAILILQLLQLHAGALWRWLDHPLARYFGRISYPLYLWHIWAITLGFKVTNYYPLQIVLSCTVAILAASASFYLVETPCMSLRGRLEKILKTRANRGPDNLPVMGRMPQELETSAERKPSKVDCF